jgi:hypothetical protein
VVRALASYEDSLVEHSSGEPLVTHRHTHRRNRRNKHKHQRHSKRTQPATDHAIMLELRRQCEPRMQRRKAGLRWRRRAVRSKTMPPIHKSASSLFCSSPWSLSLSLSLFLSLYARTLFRPENSGSRAGSRGFVRGADPVTVPRRRFVNYTRERLLSLV